MQFVIEPDRIEWFGKTVGQQLDTARQAAQKSSPKGKRISVISLAEAGFIANKRFDSAKFEPAQLVMSYVFFPWAEGEMEVTWEGTLHDQYIVYIDEITANWSDWIKSLFARTEKIEIPISLPPAAESAALEKADMLVREGKTQEGIDTVYDELDKLLISSGPQGLDQILATIEPDLLSEPILLALITTAGMSRGRLQNWRAFLPKLQNSDIVKGNAVLLKVVARLIGQSDTHAGQSFK